MIYKIMVSMVLCCLGAHASASQIKNVTVKELAINEPYGSYVFIKLSQAPERISCSINGYWDYTIKLESEANKSMFAILLAAATSGAKININGLSTPACNEFGSIESAAGINLKL